MRKSKFFLLVIAFIGILTMTIQGKNVLAAGSTQQQVAFGVEPLVSESPSQQTQDVQYWDLKLSPGEQEKIYLKLYNGDLENSVKLKSIALSGFTDQNAVVAYNENVTPDMSSNPKMIDMIKFSEPEVVLPPGSTKVVEASITAPKDFVQGVIIGGWNVQQVTDDKETSDGKISNKYGYMVGISITIKDRSIKPDVNMGDVKTESEGNHRSLLVDLMNTEPSILKNGNLEAYVTRKGQTQKIKEKVLEESTLAPSSYFTLPINWGSDNFLPGTYTLHLTYTSNDPQFEDTKVWKFTKDFKISMAESVQSAVKTKNIPWWIWLIVGLLVFLLLLVVIFIFLLLKHRKNAKNENKEGSADE